MMATEHKGSTSAAPTTNATPAPAESPLAGNGPVILDMGKNSRKSVRRLKKGKPGRLMNRVEEALEHLRENGALAADARPIIIIVREKDKKKKLSGIAKMCGLK
jgi:hypothetical protein